ncbi:hypothetical protein [Phenylobacterium sp.]|uniref:hypothetical protein n=1 Tax=Phenylobacterium sp. TaxID=1871053 RepID=UPI0035638D90
MGRARAGPATPIRLNAGSFAALPPAWVGALLRPVKSTTLVRSQFTRIHDHLAKLWGDETCDQLGLPEEAIAWQRLAFAAGAGDDATAIDLAELRARIAWPDAFPDDQQVLENGLIITTIHQSKGMEFDIVTLLEASEDAAAEDDEDDRSASIEVLQTSRLSLPVSVALAWGR